MSVFWVELWEKVTKPVFEKVRFVSCRKPKKKLKKKSSTTSRSSNESDMDSQSNSLIMRRLFSSISSVVSFSVTNEEDDNDPIMRGEDMDEMVEDESRKVRVDVDPLCQFILSMDCLSNHNEHQIMDQELSHGWSSDAPPSFLSQQLLQEFGGDGNRALKHIIRKAGVPPALRCAVWITNVVGVCHPEREEKEISDYGTLRKVRVLEYGWDVAQQDLFPDSSDEQSATMPLFGLTEEQLLELLEYYDVSQQGKGSMKRILFAAQHVLGLDYCPLLPDIVCILLSYMTESYAYAIVREMANNPNHYFPTNKEQHIAYCFAFLDLLRKNNLTRNSTHFLRPKHMDPIFKQFFRPILTNEQVFKLFDIYTLEGAKAIFRIGTCLLTLSQATAIITSAGIQQHPRLHPEQEFWNHVQKVTHSTSFHWNILLQQAYGGTLLPLNPRRSFRKRPAKVYFPKRADIANLIDRFEHYVRNHLETKKKIQQEEGTQPNNIVTKPLGLIQPNYDHPDPNHIPIPIVFAKDALHRIHLKR